MLTPLLFAEWAFQLLLGRYRSYSPFGIEHALVMAAVMTVSVVAYVSLLRTRTAMYERERRRVPRRHLPVGERVMSRRLYKDTVNELVRVNAIRAQKIQPEDAGAGDRGWSTAADAERHANVRGGVHYSRTVAKSYNNVEDAALSRRPNLRERHARSIRDYVAELEREFPRLPPDVCAEYVRYYESARFGNSKLTVDDYVRFDRAYSRIVAVMTERGSKAGRRKRSA